MTDLTRVIYDYARNRELPKYLLTEEYRAVEVSIRCQQKDLEKLSPELDSKIEDLINEINLERNLELEAMFEAALATARQIPRL